MILGFLWWGCFLCLTKTSQLQKKAHLSPMAGSSGNWSSSATTTKMVGPEPTLCTQQHSRTPLSTPLLPLHPPPPLGRLERRERRVAYGPVPGRQLLASAPRSLVDLRAAGWWWLCWLGPSLLLHRLRDQADSRKQNPEIPSCWLVQRGGGGRDGGGRGGYMKLVLY